MKNDFFLFARRFSCGSEMSESAIDMKNECNYNFSREDRSGCEKRVVKTKPSLSIDEGKQKIMEAIKSQFNFCIFHRELSQVLIERAQTLQWQQSQTFSTLRPRELLTDITSVQKPTNEHLTHKLSTFEGINLLFHLA